MDAAGTLQREISEHAAVAESLLAFRQQALTTLARHVPYDAAIFHELSPRAPLAHAALVGFESDQLAASSTAWDEDAVALGRLRELALARGGVVTDAEAFPRGTRARANWVARVDRALGVRSTLAAHLVVRDRIVSVLLLFRRGALPFGPADTSVVRSVAPALAVADALHQSLAGAGRTAVPTRLRCLDQRLTPRQRELVERVALGHTNAEIGAAVGLSAHTVRNALADARRRIGAANRAELVRLAVLR